MTAPERRGGGGLLAMGLALLVLFGVLSVVRFLIGRERFVAEQELIDELARATIIEEEPLPPDAPWSQWRGPRRDGEAGVPQATPSWPAGGLPQLWEAPAGEGYSSVVEADGRAFTLGREGDSEKVICWDAQTGKPLWEKGYPVSYSSQQGNGPRSTPTHHDGRLYTVGVTGIFQCRQAGDGALLWEHDLLSRYQGSPPQWGVSFSPLVDGDMVFTMPGGKGACAVAFDRRTGREVWRALDDPAGYASPVAMTVDGKRVVLFFTGKSLAGLSAADGKVYWRFPWETPFDVNAATPLVFRARAGGEDRHFVFLSSGYGKGCALLNVRPDGKGGLEARRVYEGDQLCSHFSSPVRHGGHVYGFNESRLVCLDLRTGKVLWRKAGYYKGSLLLAGGYLVVLGERGQLALIEASPEQCRVEADFRPLRGKCWTMPTISRGKVFLRDEEKVVCLKWVTTP